MKRALVGLIVVLVMLVPLLMPVMAQALTTAVVTLNATPSFVSISVNNTSWNFGNVSAGVDKATGTGYFGVTDTSSVQTTNTIQCTTVWEATNPALTKWTYGAPAADTAQLKASDGDGAFDVTVPSGSAPTLHITPTGNSNWVFELQLDAPSSITHGAAQGCKVTISSSS
jgi:hypothetical protein